MYEYFHLQETQYGNQWVFRGHVKASNDLEAFELACAKLKLLHRGNISVQRVSYAIH